MAYINPLKNSLRQASDLPEGYTFEEMEDGILQKMNAPKNKKRRYLWFWLIPACFVFGSFLWVINTGNNSADIKNEFKNLNPDIKNKPEKSQKIIIDNSKPSIVKIRDKKRFYASQESDQPINNSIFSVKRDTAQKEAIINKILDVEKNKYWARPGKPAVIHIEKIPFEKDVVSHFDNIDPASEVAINHTPDTTNLQNTPDSRLSNLVLLRGKIHPCQSVNNDYSMPTLITRNKTSRWQFSMEAGGGVIYWNLLNNSTGKIQQTGHEAELTIKPYSGFTAECRLSSIYMKKYVINIGIASSVQYHAFSYHGIIKENQDSQNPVVIALEKNILTGGTQEIFGITTQTVVSTRKIQNLNRDILLRVPISLGYLHKSRQWMFFAVAGGSLSVLSHQTGKTLSSGQIVNYQNHHPFSRSLNWLWEMEGKVAYQLTPDWNIGVALRGYFQNQEVFYTDQNVSKTYGIYPMIMIGKFL